MEGVIIFTHYKPIQITALKQISNSFTQARRDGNPQRLEKILAVVSKAKAILESKYRNCRHCAAQFHSALGKNIEEFNEELALQVAISRISAVRAVKIINKNMVEAYYRPNGVGYYKALARFQKMSENFTSSR